MNETGRETVSMLVQEQLTVGEAASQMAALYPRTSAAIDTRNFVADLNDAGMLNVAPAALPYLSKYGRIIDGLLLIGRAFVGSALQVTFAQRAEFSLPRQMGRLALFALFSLRAWLVLLMGMIGAAAVLIDSAFALQALAGVFVLAFSVVVHEIAHAVAMGKGTIAAIGSLSSIRIVTRHCAGHRHLVATAAGPAAGIATSAVATWAGLYWQYPVFALTGFVLMVAHAYCYLPFAADGKLISQSSKITERYAHPPSPERSQPT